jgi:hypothetical protein
MGSESRVCNGISIRGLVFRNFQLRVGLGATRPLAD